ncbi:MAG: PQQ-dependent sugar dehydrogenase [Bdellovibrionaceae bacterium]|nr:PQQ-dependent sugar dehydrogenase [Pseudobdellovibrionaceae bacterium]
MSYYTILFILYASLSQANRAELSQPVNQNQTPKKLELLFENKKTKPHFKVEVLAENLGIPWGMDFLNERELIWTEKQGLVKKLDILTGQISLIKVDFKNLYDRGQGGLLDLALHPQFTKNKKIYFTYSFAKERKQTTALAVGELKENEITNLKIIFLAQDFYNSGIHFGSRLAFDKKNSLFMTVGDRGQKELAQDLSSHLGKLLRLDENGKAFPDNPFIKNEQAKPEIYSWGHRNPQGLFIHPETHQIYLQEHGPKGGDEINLIKKGKNYGWPVITYGKSYIGFKIGEGTHKKGMEQPIKYWTPSIAPSTLLIYSGKKFKKWKGDFFSGALALSHLNRLKFRNKTVIKEERLLSSLNFRLRDVIEDPKGFIWISVDEGMILKLSPL